MEDFYTTRVQSLKTLGDTMRRSVDFLFIKRGRKMFSAIRDLFMQGHICESKREFKLCNKLSMQVNLFVEFHRKKYNLYKSHKTMTKFFTNTRLKYS